MGADCVGGAGWLSIQTPADAVQAGTAGTAGPGRVPVAESAPFPSQIEPEQPATVGGGGAGPHDLVCGVGVCLLARSVVGGPEASRKERLGANLALAAGAPTRWHSSAPSQ